MSQSSAKTENVVLNLTHDFDIAVNCFIDNGIEPHTPKYQFMVMSNNDIDTHNLKPNDTTKLISQSDVVMLGIKIIHKITFTKHVSALCTKASKQLNAFTCISKFLFND